MKICYIANPNSSHTRLWVNWFAEHGHDVLLIGDAPFKGDWNLSPLINLPDRFNIKKVRYIVWEFMLRRIIKQWKPDILHAHQVTSAGWLGAFSNFHPFVVSPWGSDLLVKPTQYRPARFLANYVLRHADLVICTSNHLQNAAIRYGAETEKCVMIPWGIDQNIFHPGDSSALRKSLGFNSIRVILSPRAMKPIYNQDTIVEAIPIVAKSIPNVIFIFLEYNEDALYLSTLKKRINELDIEKYVYWLPSQEPHQLAEYLRMADLVLSIPSSDSVPLSVIEAMACGTPVIVSDIISLREVIIPDKNGVLVPLRDPQALAQAIIALVNDSRLCSSFITYNLSNVVTHANRDSQMKLIEGYYQKLVEDKKK